MSKATKKKTENKKFGLKTAPGLLIAGTKGGIVLRVVILLLIPYACLMLSGLIFDRWLKLYSAVTAIFVGLIILYIIAIVLCVIVVKKSLDYMKGNRVPTPKKKK